MKMMMRWVQNLLFGKYSVNIISDRDKLLLEYELIMQYLDKMDHILLYEDSLTDIEMQVWYGNMGKVFGRLHDWISCVYTNWEELE